MSQQRPSEGEQPLEPVVVNEFERILDQLRCFHGEISALSKKSPDGAMNEFKLRFINDTLEKATALLGATYRPFADFEAFVSEDLPTTSDVSMMLSQYLNSMYRFRNNHRIRAR